MKFEFKNLLTRYGRESFYDSAIRYRSFNRRHGGFLRIRSKKALSTNQLYIKARRYLQTRNIKILGW